MQSNNALKNFRETSIESNTNGNKPASPSSTWSSPSLTEESNHSSKNQKRNETEIFVNRRPDNASDDNSSTTDLYSTPRLSPNTVLNSSNPSCLPI